MWLAERHALGVCVPRGCVTRHPRGVETWLTWGLDVDYWVGMFSGASLRFAVAAVGVVSAYGSIRVEV